MRYRKMHEIVDSEVKEIEATPKESVPKTEKLTHKKEEVKDSVPNDIQDSEIPF